MLENARAVYAMNLGLLKSSVKDLTPEQMVTQASPITNPPVWILGHIAVTADGAGQLLGLAKVLPDAWHQQFGQGSKPMPTLNPMPTKDELMRTIDDVRWLNHQWFEHAQEDKLQEFLTKTQAGQMVYDLVTYRGNHKEDACAFLPHILPETVKRLAVGHTPSASVRLRCEGDTFLALDSSLSRWFRNSGNEYCYGDKTQVSSNGRFQCRKKSEQCKGQIVRILSNGTVEVIV